MFELLMLASFTLIIVSQQLPVKQTVENNERKGKTGRENQPSRPPGVAPPAQATTIARPLKIKKNGPAEIISAGPPDQSFSGKLFQHF
jgi:hypothetical protein